MWGLNGAENEDPRMGFGTFNGPARVAQLAERRSRKA